MASIPPNRLGDVVAQAGTPNFVISGSMAIWPRIVDTVPPPGWLVCDGGQYSTTDPIYQALYQIIGNRFNTPDTPAGFFKVPSLVLRTAVGAGNVTPTWDISGGFGLAQGNTGIQIPINTLPQHKHTFQNFSVGSVNSTGIGAVYQNPVSTALAGVYSLIDASGNILTQQVPINTRNPFLSLYYIIKI
jgi:microcystin-dependent protein